METVFSVAPDSASRSELIRLDRRGVTSIEYALIAAIMAAAVIALSPVGTKLMVPFNVIASALSGSSN